MVHSKGSISNKKIKELIRWAEKSTVIQVGAVEKGAGRTLVKLVRNKGQNWRAENSSSMISFIRAYVLTSCYIWDNISSRRDITQNKGQTEAPF